MLNLFIRMLGLGHELFDENQKPEIFISCLIQLDLLYEALFGVLKKNLIQINHNIFSN